MNPRTTRIRISDWPPGETAVKALLSAIDQLRTDIASVAGVECWRHFSALDPPLRESIQQLLASP